MSALKIDDKGNVFVDGVRIERVVSVRVLPGRTGHPRAEIVFDATSVDAANVDVAQRSVSIAESIEKK